MSSAKRREVKDRERDNSTNEEKKKPPRNSKCEIW